MAIEINTLEVCGFPGAIYGMRNPFKGREYSDSKWDVMNFDDCVDYFEIGESDMELAQKLVRPNADDEAKFLRMIHVQADIYAPLYWWKEFDTYKISTVANSESTMHTIHKKDFTLENFSHEYFDIEVLNVIINVLNGYRNQFIETGDKKYWYQMIQLLPSSYMQLRTVDLNYQTIRHMYAARRHHKLEEWSGKNGFCAWIETLPYAKELILEGL